MPEELESGPERPGDDPELAERLRAAHGYPNRHEWQLGEWGARSGPYEASMERPGPDRATYRFCTAWSPLGMKLIAAMSGQFPALGLELSYDEPGLGFRGVTAARGGKIIRDSCENYVEGEE